MPEIGVRSRRLHGVALALALMLMACGSQTPSQEAIDKAEQLRTEAEELGVTLPDDFGVRVFAEDGAHLCAAAAEGDDRLALVAFAPSTFALRKIEVSREEVAIARAAIDVYCPEYRANLDHYLEGLNVEGSDE